MTPQPARERLLEMEQYNSRSFPLITKEALDAIEQEAVAAALARVRAAVEGMFGQFHPMCAVEAEPTRHDVVSRKAVLAAIEVSRSWTPADVLARHRLYSDAEEREEKVDELLAALDRYMDPNNQFTHSGWHAVEAARAAIATLDSTGAREA